MNTAAGLPAERRTLVAIPTIFSSVEVVEKLIEKLEVLFLATKMIAFTLLC